MASTCRADRSLGRIWPLLCLCWAAIACGNDAGKEPKPAGGSSVFDVASTDLPPKTGDTQAADAGEEVAPDVAPTGDQAAQSETDVKKYACANSDDCPAAAPACWKAAGQCVQCVWSAQCPGPNGRCANHQCLAPEKCNSDGDCAGGVCDKATGYCANCTAKSGCQDGEKCIAGSCIAAPPKCPEAGNCSGSQTCIQGTGCVDCQADGDCAKAENCTQNLCLPDVCKPGDKACVDGDHSGVCQDNGGGFASSPCPADTKCESGACKALVCKPNETVCQGDLVQKCSDTGTSKSVTDDCAAKKQLCIGGACVATLCTPGSTKCDAGQQAICSEDGMVWQKKPCPDGSVCAGTTCKPTICEPGTKACIDGKVMLCSDDATSLSMYSNCAGQDMACANGKCAIPKCVPGAKVCQGAAVGVCDSNAVNYVLTPCAATETCDKGACVPLVCKAGEANCLANVAYQCDATGTKNTLVGDCTVGAKVCDAGACKVPVCKPGDKSCQLGQIGVCNAKGLGYDLTACPAGQACGPSLGCEAMICTPSAKFCSGAAWMQCNDTGLGASKIQDCPVGQLCTPSGCLNQVCKPGATDCQGEDLATCAATGLQWNAAPCPNGQACENGACVAKNCTPYQLSCQGDQLMLCDGKGIHVDLAKDCTPSGMVCDALQCKKPICKPGAMQCQAGKLATCINKGLAWDAQPCPNATICDVDSCKAVICTANAKTCDGNVLKACNATGTAQTVAEDCGAAGKICDAQQCKALVCKPSEATCLDSKTVSNCDAKGLSAALLACGDGTVCSAGKCQQLVCAPSQAFCKGNLLNNCAADGLSSTLQQDCAAAGQVCDQGQCKPLVCKPATTACQNGKFAQCASNGLQWNTTNCPPTTACSVNACKPILCTPGAVSCDGNLLRVCDPTGTDNPVQTDCGLAGKVCDQGACKTQICTPNAATCDTNKVKLCDGKGLNFTLTACATGKSCQGGSCVPQVCSPNTFSCSGNVLQLCDAVGLALNATLDCAKSGQVCDQGACKTPICTPNSVTCKGIQLATCIKTGLDYVVTSCPNGQACDQGQCKTQACTPNSKVCAGFVVVNCDATGLVKTNGADCSATQQACVNGACVTPGCWPPGFKKCAGAQVATCKADATAYDVVACNDSDACTYNTCDDVVVACAFPPNKDCDDKDICTKDSCDKASGNCVHSGLTGPCDDGNACSKGESCATGKCTAAPAFDIATLAGADTAGAVDAALKSARFNAVNGLVRGPDGVWWFADSGNHRIRAMDAQGNVTTPLGALGAGFVDGQASAAKFNNPQGIAIDAAGALYIADRGNNRVRKVTVDGYVTTYMGASGQLSSPSDVALAKNGNLFIADAGNYRVKMVKPDGSIANVCGSGAAGFGDADCASAKFSTIEAIAILADGSIAVADNGNLRLRVIAANFASVATVAGNGQSGSTDGSAVGAKFSGMTSVLGGPSGEIYVGDGVRVRLYDGTTVATIAGGGSSKSDGSAALFALVGSTGLAWGSDRTLWLADSNAIRKMTPTAMVGCDDLQPCTNDSCDATTGKCVYAPAQVSSSCDDGTACTSNSACDDKAKCVGTLKGCNDSNSCTFDVCDALTGNCDSHPTAATCSDGDACTTLDACLGGKCVTDQANLATLAGNTSGYADGTGASALLTTVYGMAVTADGTLVFADSLNHVIRQMTPDGKVTTVAGQAGKTGGTNGAALQSLFAEPRGLAIDLKGRYVVTETAGHRVRLIDPKTGLVSTISGTGSAGLADGPAGSAAFNAPQGVAVDSTGAIFVYDAGNRRIRKIFAGIVTVVAGTGNIGKQDGAATTATFGATIHSMHFGSDGGLYLCDTDNSAIRKMKDGQLSTYAGGTAGYAEGALSGVKFSAPTSLGFDLAGNLFVADTNNFRLRRITAAGIASTETGNGTSAVADGLGASSGYKAPLGLAVAGNGVVYVADANKIRRSQGPSIDCNDGDVCTIDKCDSKSGACSHSADPNPVACEDGNPCTVSDTCNVGLCKGGPPKDCNDNNPCTADGCDNVTGCLHVPTAEWQACGQTGNYCQAGACNPSPCGSSPPTACLGFQGSTVLNQTQQLQLMTWHGSTAKKWGLCYKGSANGFNSTVFHAKCDTASASMVVLKASGGEIFGGFANATWAGNGTYADNTGGWLFQLNKGYKLPVASACASVGVFRSPGAGPTFGGGYDLQVSGGMKSGTSALGYSYPCTPNGTATCNLNATCADVLAAPADAWTLDEVEVFVLQ